MTREPGSVRHRVQKIFPDRESDQTRKIAIPARMMTITTIEILMNQVNPIQVRRCRSSSGSTAAMSASPIEEPAARYSLTARRVEQRDFRRRRPANRHRVAADAEPPLGEEAHRHRVEAVFGGEDALGQKRLVIVGMHGYDRLGNDRT